MGGRRVGHTHPVKEQADAHHVRRKASGSVFFLVPRGASPMRSVSPPTHTAACRDIREATEPAFVIHVEHLILIVITLCRNNAEVMHLRCEIKLFLYVYAVNIMTPYFPVLFHQVMFRTLIDQAVNGGSCQEEWATG